MSNEKKDNNIITTGRNNTASGNVDTIDLAEVFFEMVEHWKMLFASTIMVGLIAFLISRFLITPMYASTAEFYVLSKSTSITSIADLQIGTNLTSDYMEVINGRPVLDKVINDLGLDESYEHLKSRVSLTNPADSRIMMITVKDPNPKQAKKIADDIADVSSAFIAEKMDQDPPNIIQYGYSDHDPVSPNVGRNTLVGALIGFLIAAAVIVVSYVLNDTITDPDDIEKKLGIHVLATLPKDVVEYNGDDSKSRSVRHHKNSGRE